MPTMQSELTEQAKKLSISDRILLVEEIWDTIAEESQAFELTDAQKQELDRESFAIPSHISSSTEHSDARLFGVFRSLCFMTSPRMRFTS
jgi:putative addiction module component (TIGR02574 family)